MFVRAQPCYADGTSQTETNEAEDDDKCSALRNPNQQKISRIRATLVEVCRTSRRLQEQHVTCVAVVF